MIDMLPTRPERAAGRPTIWGLTPTQIHDRFWASRGVQVVRPGEASEIVESAELFLLVDATSLVIFRLRDLVEMLSWLRPRLVTVRLRDEGHHGYKEVVCSTEDGRLVQLDRIYEGLDSRLARVGLTPDGEVARLWQTSSSSAEGWSRLRHAVPRDARQARGMPGRVFNGASEEEQMRLIECLVDRWGRPDSTVPRTERGPQGVWLDRESTVASKARVVGSVWVGAGRRVLADDLVVGPAILWDDPGFEPITESVPWQDLEPVAIPGGLVFEPTAQPALRRAGKRAFDILFASFALLLTVPLYPFIALAIMLEDGWPVFFAHRRETLGGKEFPCLKFRSMRRDAEEIKKRMMEENVADGPQFFVENDPRSTRIGRILRKTQLDELPQFFNVLMGHMSVVGPRPSPRSENQYCPAWREARLSVRPGVTGLWQIRRTRAEGLDFQEWIRYDLQYVEKMSWKLDFWVIWKTLGVVLRKGTGK